MPIHVLSKEGKCMQISTTKESYINEIFWSSNSTDNSTILESIPIISINTLKKVECFIIIGLASDLESENDDENDFFVILLPDNDQNDLKVAATPLEQLQQQFKSTFENHRPSINVFENYWCEMQIIDMNKNITAEFSPVENIIVISHKEENPALAKEHWNEYFGRCEVYNALDSDQESNLSQVSEKNPSQKKDSSNTSQNVVVMEAKPISLSSSAQDTLARSVAKATPTSNKSDIAFCALVSTGSQLYDRGGFSVSSPVISPLKTSQSLLRHCSLSPVKRGLSSDSNSMESRSSMYSSPEKRKSIQRLLTADLTSSMTDDSGSRIKNNKSTSRSKLHYNDIVDDDDDDDDIVDDDDDDDDDDDENDNDCDNDNDNYKKLITSTTKSRAYAAEIRELNEKSAQKRKAENRKGLETQQMKGTTEKRRK